MHYIVNFDGEVCGFKNNFEAFFPSTIAIIQH